MGTIFNRNVSKQKPISIEKQRPHLKLMPYNQTGAMAIRIDKGPQLIQIKSKQGAKQSKALAEKLLAELKNGMSLGDAKAWKAARLAKEK